MKKYAFKSALLMLFAWSAAVGANPVFQPERGINLSHWLAQTSGPDHRPNAATEEDLELLHALGFDHVRLPIDPAYLWNFSGNAQLDEKMLQAVDAAVRMALDHDLKVVIDLHPRTEFKMRLRTEPGFFVSFLELWDRFARHLADYDHSRVAFELLNEPSVNDPAVWQAMAERLHAAVRRAAPEHTIVIGGAAWSNTLMLRQLKPVPDANVLYTFHFYDPHAFTHQGAGWGDPVWKKLKNLPYPVDDAAIQKLAASTESAAAKAALEAYRKAGWNAERIAAQVKEAADWADAHDVRIWCGEFGAYRKTCAEEDRMRYIRDVRQALEDHDIGWTMWDYRGGFSLLDETAVHPTIDPPVAAALGLDR